MSIKLIRLIKKLSIISLLIILMVIIVSCSTQTNNSKNGPSIELSETFFDLGDINPDLGKRTETFIVKNVGNEPLEIYSVSTSCGCTDAEVDKETIMPNKETTLTVTYDPSVHPGLVGKMERVIYIKSNDLSNEEVELTLIGNSLPSSNVDIEKGLTSHKDNLRSFEISPSDLNYKMQLNNKPILIDVREVFEFNEGHLDNSINLPLGEIEQSSLENLGLQKDDEIILYCRSGKRSAKAYNILKGLGYTNIKSMNGGILHWVEEGFETKIEEDLLN